MKILSLPIDKDIEVASTHSDGHDDHNDHDDRDDRDNHDDHDDQDDRDDHDDCDDPDDPDDRNNYRSGRKRVRHSSSTINSPSLTDSEDFSSLPKSLSYSRDDEAKPYLTSKNFNYTMNLIDAKINSLYKLCRYLGDQQQNSLKSLQKLVALDELSDDFWNVS